MTDYLLVGSIDEVPAGGEPLVVEIGGQWVAIFNVDNELFAIADVCTHDDGPLAEGALDGCIVECPRHGARFDISTGKALTAPAYVDIPTYYVELVDDQVFVSQKPK